MRLARRHVRRLWDGTATGADEAAYRACHAAVFRPILNKLGFDCLELVISGGAPLPPETTALWHMYGVNVLEIYGQTEEAGGIITGQRGQFPRPGNVGTAPDGWMCVLPMTARFWCVAPTCSNAIGAMMMQRAPSNMRTAGCGPATSAHGRTVRLRLDRSRARFHRDVRRQDDIAFVHRE